MKIVYSPEAEEDIDAIKNYLLNKESVQRAGDVIGSIIVQIEKLDENPERFRLRPELGKDIHLVSSKKYNIYYRIMSGHVQILRIIYGNRLITKDTFASE